MIQHLDLYLFHLVNDWCGDWFLDRAAGYVEASNLFKGGIVMSAFCWFWFTGRGEDREARRRTILVALASALLALIVNRAVASALPLRVRPMYEAGIGYHAPSLPLAFDLENWSSFPSDHATYFFALSSGLFFLSRPVGLLMMFYSVLWVCLPRLYLGIHYPSDLAFGALLGIAVAVAVRMAMTAKDRALERRATAPVLAFERMHPGPFYAAAFVVSFEMAAMFDDLRSAARALAHGLRLGGHLSFGAIAAVFLIAAAVPFAAALILAMRRRRKPIRMPGREAASRPE